MGGVGRIVAKNSNGALCRLIHNKMALEYGRDQYVWNEVPCSRGVAMKAKQSKAKGLWPAVKDEYISLKNKYLTGLWGKDHPSFVVYTEAVNNVYNQYFT